ncbi:hypothetical protein DPMN_159216 [Dreissena polymorpha]|uniref:Uncharacterized protein n=1 Tax=Dreissena polymorpha TaxID=45954 RepID=A0A9D4EIP2_DREPO|nr:hypothetical protein DPMN_159216 [Dreissena polymorpha]
MLKRLPQTDHTSAVSESFVHMSGICYQCGNRILKAFENSLDPDETPQNVASHQDPNYTRHGVDANWWPLCQNAAFLFILDCLSAIYKKMDDRHSQNRWNDDELVIENKNLLEGKHGPLATEANKRKSGEDCGNHKRVWGGETPRQYSTVPRPSGHQQDTQRRSATVPIPSRHRQETFRQYLTVPDSPSDRRGTCSRPPDSLRRYQTVSQTEGEPAGDTQTVCNSARQSLTPSKTVWESPAGAQTVFAPSQTVWESPAGAQTVGRLSDTVWESPAGARTVLAPSQTVW